MLETIDPLTTVPTTEKQEVDESLIHPKTSPKKKEEKEDTQKTL